MANRYWVGGSGTWNASSTTNWSTTSGGAGGASAPTSADAVIIDSASGTGTITTASGAGALSVAYSSTTLALTLGANLTVSGAFTLTQGTFTLGSNTLTCVSFGSSNSNVRTLDFGSGKIVLTGNNAGIWSSSQSANFTVAGAPRIECTYAGATGTRTLTLPGTTTGGTEARALNFYILAGTDTVATSGNATIGDLDFTGFSGTLTNSARFVYGSLVLSSTMTLVAGTSVTNFISTDATSITTAGKTIDFPLTFNGVGGAWSFQDALTQGSTRAFTITNGTIKLKNGVTSTVGAFATSGTNQKFLQSTLAGSQATLSQASGTVNASNLTIQDVNATGGATWNAYTTNNNVNAGNNTGWDFYLPVNSIYDSLRLRGYTGTVTDMLLQYYKANGATSNSLQDAESEFLILKGFTSGSNTDKWFAYLRSLNFTGTVTDMLFNYWKDPA